MKRRRRPVQQSLPLSGSPKQAGRILGTHAERNREAGALILVDPGRYGGDGSLPVVWAKRVMEGE